MSYNNASTVILTEEERQIIERNRQKALALRAAAVARHKLATEAAHSAKQSAANGFMCRPKEALNQEKTKVILPITTTIPIPSTQAQCKAICSVISRERFSVNVGFHNGLVTIMKSIPSHAYVPKGKTWNFLLSDHNKLMQLAKPLEPNVFIVQIPQFVLKLFQNVTSVKQQVADVDLSTIDTHLVESLFPFQRDAICFGIRKQGRVLIADDMGLGKTIEAIGIASYYKREWPLLVIAPSSMRYAWREAFQNWLPSLDPQSVTVVNTAKDNVGNVSVLIVSYDLLTRMADFMVKRNFQVVIVDESHLLKNFKTARTKAASPLLKIAKRVILLSGTPALSRPSELFTQISSVNPQIFPSFKEFAYRYCNAKLMPWGLDTSGASHMKELHHVLEEHLMIRRLKSDVIAQLPPKRREMVLLDPTKISTNTKAMKLANRHINEDDLHGIEKRGALLQYFHKTGTAKINAICGYVIDLLEAGKKFLCFAHHREVLDSICNAIGSKTPNLQFIRIDGSTAPEKRKELCDRFQMSDSYRVAVLSITAANMGITLTAAQLVVFAELFWNPGILTQAEDRAHRIGQVDSVLVQYLIARGTSDDYLWPLVKQKLEVLNKAGLSKDSFSDVDTKVVLCAQPTIKDFFENEDNDWLNKIDWDENCGIDLLEQPSKKIKLDEMC